MRIKRTLLAFAALALVLSSCSNDKMNGGLPEESGIRFSSSIGGDVVETRSSKTSWDANDQIGIFMKKGANMGTIVDNGDNVKYTTASGDGNFIWATPADKLQYPSDGSSVDFISYYPYNQNLNATNTIQKIDVTNQTDLKAISYLYAKVEGLAGNAAVNLSFQHQLAQVEFTISSIDVNLDGMSVSVKGMNKKADLDLATKALTPDAASIGDIVIKTDHQTGATTAVAKGIVIPNQNADRKVVFTVGGSEFAWTVPAATKYEAGKKYKYKVTLKQGATEGILPKADIVDWDNITGEDIDIDLGDDPAALDGDGTKASPYTVSDAITLKTETSKWVEGVIIAPTAYAVNANFYLAKVAGETDPLKMVAVDLTGSTVAGKLDIVADPTLVGKTVKLETDFALTAGLILLSNITDQVGGTEGTAGGLNFFETFGITDKASEKGKLDGTYDKFDMTTGITYSDPYEGKWADIRTTNGFLPTYNMHVWFPSYTNTLDKEAGLLIEGIETGYTNMKLSYELALNTKADDLDINKILVVKCNDQLITLPEIIYTSTDFQKVVEVSIPDNTTKIEFYSGTINRYGIRLDNIKITGDKN